MILDDIVIKRKGQLKLAKAKISDNEIIALAKKITSPTKDFKAALSTEKLAVISEVKKASPSKGLICENFNPVEIAKTYEKAGANAISVLTEEFYFKGSSDFLTAIRKEVSIPLLRKDFIIDPYQIYEARVIGADAILLIAALLDTNTIIQYRKIAADLGLHCLVEVHNEEELSSSLQAKCDIIGINNRDLKTFNVSLEVTSRLAKLIPNNCIIVSESGIATNEDMLAVKNSGANAVLIGETLMRSGNISATLNSLRG